MCGIFGAVGQKNAPAITLKKLKQLEYRGYDSWGIASLDQKTKKIIIQKQTGQIQATIADLQNPDSSFAFGHTRWATHGGITQQNAHPHANSEQTLAIVHNGIIENYQELKQQLQDKYLFQSETDTEVFVYLVQEQLEKHDLAEAVRLAFGQIQGYSAFIVADSQTETMVAIKNGSPLIIGIGEKNQKSYVASDVHALLDLTRKMIFLEDQQMAVLQAGQKVKFLSVETGETIQAQTHHLDWSNNQAEQHDYSCYLEKEIHDQQLSLNKIRWEFEPQIKKLASLIKKYKQIYLVGCGTAYHAALTSQYFLSEIAGVKTQAVAGSEFKYYEKFCQPENTLIIFFSQSGETIDIIQPLKHLKKKKITTVGVVNTFGSSLYRLTDHKIWLKAGPEVSVLSTKAFTAKIALMQLTAAYLAGKQTYQKALTDYDASLKDLEKILSDNYQQQYLQPLVKKLKKQPNIFGIGRGCSYPLILEGALKIKEVTYLHMEGFAGGELKHGVIALVEPGVPCFVLAPKDQEKELILSGAMEIKSRGGLIVGLADENNKIFDHWLPVPTRGNLSSLTSSVILQLIAFHLAIEMDKDPDKPRNLAKSVTVV